MRTIEAAVYVLGGLGFVAHGVGWLMTLAALPIGPLRIYAEAIRSAGAVGWSTCLAYVMVVLYDGTPDVAVRVALLAFGVAFVALAVLNARRFQRALAAIAARTPNPPE